MTLSRSDIELQLSKLEREQQLFAVTFETAKRTLEQNAGAIKLCKSLLQSFDEGGQKGNGEVVEEGA